MLVTRLAVHSFTDHWVSPSFKNSKPRLQRQRTRVQWLRMSALECFAHFLCHSVHKPTTWNYHILRIRGENVKYEGQIKKKNCRCQMEFLATFVVEYSRFLADIDGPCRCCRYCVLKDVRANCFCASLLCTQILIPRLASSACTKYLR